MAIWITPSGTIREVQNITFDQAKDLVKGHITTIQNFGDKERMMLLDDDGIMKGLEYNLTASMLAKQTILGSIILLRSDEIKIVLD